MSLRCNPWGLAAVLIVGTSLGNAQEYTAATFPVAQQSPRRSPGDELNFLREQIHEQEMRLQRLEMRSGPFSTAAMTSRASESEEAKNPWVAALAKPTRKWSGRVHFDYWPFPTNSALPNNLETGDTNTGPRDFIGFRRLRFGVKGDVTATMLYKIEMDFADPESLVFKDAYLGCTELPYLRTVLLGNQKRPYGLDHLSSSRYTVFMERPLGLEAIVQDTRRVGLQSYGLSENKSWNWRYGVFIMDDLAKTGHQRTDNYQPEIAGRLANTIWYDETSTGRGYAHWAISGSAAFPGGRPDARFLTRPEARTSRKWFDTGVIAGGDSYQMIGFEGVVNVGALQVVGEYQHVELQRQQRSALQFGGGYLYVAYFLTGEHTPWERKSGTIGRVHPLENFFVVKQYDGTRGIGRGAWQLAARYSYGDFTDEDIFGGVGNTFTLGLNWWWTPYSRMQFNYIHGNISERVVAGAPETSGDYDMFGTRFMVDF